MTDKASYIIQRNPLDVAGDIPVEDYAHTPDRRNPDDDSRRIQQTTAFHRAAVSATKDETTYTAERALICLDNLDLVTEGRHVDEVSQAKALVRGILKSERNIA